MSLTAGIGSTICREAVGVENPLVGAWRLERYTDTPEGGLPVYPYGDPPIGLFIFTAEGDVSINIMRNPIDPETPSSNPYPHTCIPGWYCSYFGTYNVDVAAGIWTTHVVGGNVPSFIGTDQPRSFKISGDVMVLSGAYIANDRTIQISRVLRRIGR